MLYQCKNGHKIYFKGAPYPRWVGYGILVDPRECCLCGKRLVKVKETDNGKAKDKNPKNI